MDNPPPARTGKRIKSVETAFEVLRFIGANGGANLPELTFHLDHSKSSLHYYLKTLMAERYVVENNGEYRLGLRLLEFGGLALINQAFSNNIIMEAETLAEETKETVIVATEEAGKGICIYQSSHFEDRFGWHLGKDFFLHTNALGKVILAHYPEEYVFNIIERYGLPAQTENTVTDQNNLLLELEKTRQTGVSFDKEECQKEIKTIAAPIKSGSTVVGSIGLITDQSGAVLSQSDHYKAERFKEKPSNVLSKHAQIISNKMEDEGL